MDEGVPPELGLQRYSDHRRERRRGAVIVKSFSRFGPKFSVVLGQRHSPYLPLNFKQATIFFDGR